MTTSKVKLSYKERDRLFKKYFTELKIKVALNWFELLAMLVLAFFLTFKAFGYAGMNNLITTSTAASFSSIVVTALFCYIRKYKLTINRFDKENIYKRLSNELIEETKS